MKVSVITVCFNSEKYIERALNSVLNQAYDNIEYIIVDGGSNDRTLDILGKYNNRIHKIISEPDEGIFDAMNKGIKNSSGDVLFFLNSDDYFYDNNTVKDAVEFFGRKKKVDFIYGDLMYVDSLTGKTWRYRYPRIITKIHFVNDSIGHPATFFRRRCFDKAGYYDSSFKISSDREWFLRALYKKNLHTAFIDRIVTYFQYGAGVSNSDRYRDHQLREKELIRRIYFNQFEIGFGEVLNFIVSGNILRVIARSLLGTKGYNFLKTTSNRS